MILHTTTQSALPLSTVFRPQLQVIHHADWQTRFACYQRLCDGTGSPQPMALRVDRPTRLRQPAETCLQSMTRMYPDTRGPACLPQ